MPPSEGDQEWQDQQDAAAQWEQEQGYAAQAEAEQAEGISHADGNSFAATVIPPSASGISQPEGREEILLKENKRLQKLLHKQVAEFNQQVDTIRSLQAEAQKMREEGKKLVSACWQYIEHNEDWPKLLDAVKEYTDSVPPHP